MHQLGSFLNIMRISSSATNAIKGVCFCSAVFEKLAGKHDPRLTLLGENHYIDDHFKLQYGQLTFRELIV